jgi:hypothetical protein
MNEEYSDVSISKKDKIEVKINKNMENGNKRNINSFTPSPGSKKPSLNKFPLEDVTEFDEIVQNSKIHKLSLTTKASKTKSIETDSLLGKMPNFVRCYDDLIDLIKVDSMEKLKDEKPDRKQTEASKFL